jgi:hypothetical protein
MDYAIMILIPSVRNDSLPYEVQDVFYKTQCFISFIYFFKNNPCSTVFQN